MTASSFKKSEIIRGKVVPASELEKREEKRLNSRWTQLQQWLSEQTLHFYETNCCCCHLPCEDKWKKEAKQREEQKQRQLELKQQQSIVCVDQPVARQSTMKFFVDDSVSTSRKSSIDLDVNNNFKMKMRRLDDRRINHPPVIQSDEDNDGRDSDDDDDDDDDTDTDGNDDGDDENSVDENERNSKKTHHSALTLTRIDENSLTFSDLFGKLDMFANDQDTDSTISSCESVVMATYCGGEGVNSGVDSGVGVGVGVSAIDKNARTDDNANENENDDNHHTGDDGRLNEQDSIKQIQVQEEEEVDVDSLSIFYFSESDNDMTSDDEVNSSRGEGGAGGEERGPAADNKSIIVYF